MNNSAGLKLGSLTLDVPFFQASLSGYSDYAMRMLARRFGCPFTMADMMLAKSAANPRVLRKAIFRPGCDEHPTKCAFVPLNRTFWQKLRGLPSCEQFDGDSFDFWQLPTDVNVRDEQLTAGCSPRKNEVPALWTGKCYRQIGGDR